MFATTWENIKKNYETTVPGLITAVAGLVAIFYPGETDYINKIAYAVAGISFAIFTLLTKSANVTGTALNPRAQVVNEPTPPLSPAAVEKIAVIRVEKNAEAKK